MFSLRVATALLIVLLAGEARAQINTEKMRTGKRKSGVHGFVDGRVLLRMGNVNVFQVGAAARLELVRGIHSTFLQGSILFGQRLRDNYINKGFLHLRWTAMWHPRVGSELFSQVQFNEFVRLNLRTVAGTGVRVAVILNKRIEVYFGSGYMFEYEELDMPANDPHPRVTRVHRWTNYLSVILNVGDNRFALISTTYAQPRFDRPKDVRVLQDLVLQVTAFKQFKVVVGVALAYDSDPPREVKPLDSTLSTKLRVAW